jgi:lipopolysaccharide exporter
LGLAMVAEPFVLTVFGERWVDSIPVMRAISIYAMLFSLSYNAGDVYKAQGRPEVLTKLAPVRAVVLIVGFWYAITQVGTIEAVGWAHAVAALIAGAVNLVVAARMLHLPLTGVVAALRPAVLGSSLMTLAVLGTLSLVAGAVPVVQLAASISVGALTYALALWVLQRDVLLGAGVTLRAAMKRA